jgi:hypothetical protein
MVVLLNGFAEMFTMVSPYIVEVSDGHCCAVRYTGAIHTQKERNPMSRRRIRPIQPIAARKKSRKPLIWSIVAFVVVILSMTALILFTTN